MQKNDQTHLEAPIKSPNSGVYQPGPTDESRNGNAELDIVQASKGDIMLEEFPEGPYGSPRNEERLGKSTPWDSGQASVSVHRDQNPVESDRKTTLDEPPSGAPRGSIEGQN